MKKEIHAQNYRPVIFMDITSGDKFLIPSTVRTSEKAKWDDGQEYDVYKVEISSASHPFYTGKKTIIDSGGRVQQFMDKMKKAEEAKQAKEAAAKKKATGHSVLDDIEEAKANSQKEESKVNEATEEEDKD